MDQKILESYLAAGRIAAQVREESKGWIKPGIALLELAERIEARIAELGAEPAFPVNLSLNDVAAHYTPVAKDATVLNENDILKVDLGVHIDGWIGDTAYSISFSPEHAQLIKASEVALETAIELCKPGAALSEIGKAIEHAITSAGFKPISNLTGHGLDCFDLHAEPQVPNISISSSYRLRTGQVITIEPFATTGAGQVKETSEQLIFALVTPKATRNASARAVIAFGQARAGLPFAQRWLQARLGLDGFKLRLALKELIDRKIVRPYPILREVSGGVVSQTEHTVIVDNPPIVTTKKI